MITRGSHAKIIGPDGRAYRIKQPIYTVTKFGAIQERMTLDRFEC